MPGMGRRLCSMPQPVTSMDLFRTKFTGKRV